MRALFFSVVFVGCVAGSGMGATLNVPSVYSTIQSAIDAAVNGDTVLVAPGSYDENLNFGGKGVAVRSSAGPNTTFLTPSNLTLPTISFASNEPATAEITGFDILGLSGPSGVSVTNGASPKISSNVFRSHIDVVIRCSNGNALITRNLFIGNSGISCVGIYSGSARIINNTFDRNGRGIFSISGQGIALNNIITNSKRPGDGGYGIHGPFALEDYNNVWNNVDNYEGQTPGAHDISVDPMFQDTSALNYQLSSGSQCINAGDPDPSYNDPDGTRNDMGAIYYNPGPPQPTVSYLTVASENQTHVISHTPSITWHYSHPSLSQQSYEIEVGTDANWSVAEMWASGAVVSADSFATYVGGALIDGVTYYYRVRVSDGNSWSSWIVSSFRMNTAPPPPLIKSPPDGATIAFNGVELVASRAADPEGDGVSITFEVYSDVSLTNLVSTITNGDVQDNFARSGIIAGLSIGDTFWWRTRANDGFETSVWAPTKTFTTRPSGLILRVPMEFPTIQAAVDAFGKGDSIYIGSGLYSGADNQSITSFGKPLTILGAGINETVIDLGGSGDTAFILNPSYQDSLNFHSLTIRNGAGGIFVASSTVILDSVKFSGLSQFGVGAWIEFLDLENCIFDNSGSAVLWPAGFRIESCTFIQNSIAIDLFYGGWYSSFVKNCVFQNNQYIVKSAELKKAKSFSEDQRQEHYSVVELAIDSCMFESNGIISEGSSWINIDHSRLIGSAVIFEGGHAAHMTLKNCIIRETSQVVIRGRNTTTVAIDSCQISSNPGDIFLDPVGTYYYDGSNLDISSSTIDSNGGRFRVVYTDVNIFNSTYRHNAYPLSFTQDGNYGSLDVYSCTIASNLAGGAHFAPTSIPSWGTFSGVNKSVVVDNIGSGISVAEIYADSVRVICSDVFNNALGNYVGIPDQTGINGNISADPLFCDTANGDYRIAKQSPCAPLNNSCGVQIGAFGIGCALPEVSAIEVENVPNNLHLLNHSPLFDWNLQDTLAGAQTAFEIAVGTDNDWAFAEKWNPAPFNTPDTFVTYAGGALVDGETYYLRLRVSNGTEWSAWYNTSFRMNSVPATPSPLSPDSGVGASATPTLWVLNATDAEIDALIYEFQGFHDTDCVAPPIALTGVAQTPDSTGGVITTPLGENCRYWWQVRAFDGYEYSPWSVNSMFAVNGTPEPPTAPGLTSPPEPSGKPVFDLKPTFVWGPSSDPDPNDTVKYRLEISTTQNFTFVNTIDSLLAPTHEVADSLFFGTRYWWKVSAFDKTGLRTYAPTVNDFWTWKLGDVDHSHTVNIVDLTTMVAYLFTFGPAPLPKKIADFNGNCTVNIVDLTYLVNYLFKGGPEPRIGCAL